MASRRWNTAERSRPDAIICDVHMPRMDGIEALPRLREACPEGVIVMWSSDPDSALSAPGLGADAVVDKAEDPAGLMDLLVGLSSSRVAPLARRISVAIARNRYEIRHLGLA